MIVDASKAQCLIFTYKDGLLSRVGHDLKLRCDDFSVTLEEGRVAATFNPDAFTCVTALKNGRDNPSALSVKDKRQIIDNLRKSVLEPKRFSSIRFSSTQVSIEGNAMKIRGDLTLHGATRSIEVTARRVSGEWTAEVELHQPDFGIKPFTALMGTLKVKPKVRIRMVVPAEE
ncbi:MAG: YceI family protein [Myxococcota bacterium]